MILPRRSRTHKDANSRVPENLIRRVSNAVDSLDSRSFKAEYLKRNYLQKFVSKDTSPASVRRQRAINKWLATERTNEGTNVRLMTVDAEFNILPRVTYQTFISTVSRFILEVVGNSCPWDSLLGGFSGGATTSRRRTESHPAQKYLGKADVTARAYEWFKEVISESPLWSELRGIDLVNIVEGNVLFTVPKNHEIDRCACKEPDFNMYMQRGLGLEIRSNLQRVGIDLNDQSKNRDLARRGSIDGSLATLDLSSASDSIARELVFQLMPIHWFVALDSLRSPVTLIDGDMHVNEMFSSMGNGFTFELESLLFYTIARATCYHTGVSGVVSVYGDDIIVPTAAAHDLISVLSFLGFSTNEEKSFIDGPVRESCGGHYHNGYDITPFFLKGEILCLTDLIHTANSIRRWSLHEGFPILDSSLEDLWWELARLVPKEFWGGHDVNFKGQLVSDWKPDRPKRLIPVKKSIPNGPGGYIHWLDVKRKMKGRIPIVTSERYRDSTLYRAVKANRYRSFGGPDACFLSEVTAEYVDQ